MNYLYERYKKEYKNDTKVLEELDIIYNNFNDFKFFKPGIFTKENIEKYGIENLKNALDNDKTALLKESNIKRINYFLEHMPQISEKIFYAYDFDLEIIKNYANNSDLKSLFWGYINNETIEKFKKIFTNDEVLNNLLFLSTKFQISNISQDLYKIINEKEFTIFTKIVDQRYITKNHLLNYFLDIYKNNKHLFSDNLTNDEEKIINNYIFNKDHLSFSLNINKLEKYFEEREKSIKMRVRFSYGSTLKDLIAEVYFGRRYDQLKFILEDTKNILIKENKDTKEIDEYINLFKIDDKEILKKELEKLRFKTIIAGELIDRNKKTSKEQMIDKLCSFCLIKSNEIIKLNGQDFYMLVHKIKGFSNSQIATELHRDPSTWVKNYEEDSYISTSAINQLHLGIVDGDGYVIGFRNLNENDILQMGPKDILTDKKMVKNDIDNNLVRYMEPDDLIKNTTEVYNEVVLKRFKKKEPILPNYVVSLDKVSSKDKEVSDYFNIPIYEIETKSYIDKLVNKFSYLISKHDYINAMEILKILTTGFNTCYYARSKYLNKYALQEELNFICQSFNGSKEELEIIIKTFKDITNLLSRYYDSYISLDLEEIKKHTK